MSFKRKFILFTIIAILIITISLAIVVVKFYDNSSKVTENATPLLEEEPATAFTVSPSKVQSSCVKPPKSAFAESV